MKNLLVNIVLFLCFAIQAKGRGASVYNLNINNGLPADYVYCMLVDKYGYLWISTTKGVIRYNGYETKLYNYANGLPKEDIWRLFEDKKGRIWCSTISRQIGYLYQNKFHTVINTSKKTLYPSLIKDYKNGIFFVGQYFDENTRLLSFYIERNDSIFAKILPSPAGTCLIADENSILILENDTILKAIPNLELNNQHAFKRSLEFMLKGFIVKEVFFLMGNNILAFSRDDRFINIGNLKKHSIKTLDFWSITGTTEKPKRVFEYFDGQSNNRDKIDMIISDKSIYTLDSSLSIKKLGSIKSFFSKEPSGKNVSFYIRDSSWNHCLSTINKGVFIGYDTSTTFSKLPNFDLKDNIYIGKSFNRNGYWWNNETKTMTSIAENLQAKHRKISISNFENIVAYSKDSSILIAKNAIYWFDHITLKTTNFLDGFSKIHTNVGEALGHASPLGSYNIVTYSRGNFYLFSKTKGLCHFVSYGDSLDVHYLNQNKFDNISYDSLRHDIWLYSHDDIEVYNDDTKQFSVSLDSLRALNIRNIEKILVDNKYGNKFIKDYDRLLVFNKDISNYHTLFDNYILSGALVQIQDNILIVAGSFGVLFCKIEGPLRFSGYILHQNIKNIAYDYVNFIQIQGKKVLLSTDKGIFVTDIPSDTEFKQESATNTPAFKLILFYNDSLRKIGSDDTVRVYQYSPKLQFDIINPRGNGKAVYKYLIKEIDSEWHELATGDLLLPQLTPGKYYTLIMTIHDNTWKSDQLYLKLYILPYWWQKPLWQRIFLIIAIILIALFGYVVAVITRQIVIKKNARRNLQLELELKAIYSQINPHFIYNTLNSALLLIHNKKTEEAYSHISKFSRLLRAYVKSSRNKYITINEEVTNLRNYIELQQTRFKNKFNYEIKIDEKISGDKIKIPSLLLQPFVENAINHGLRHNEKSGNLMIEFKLKPQKNELTCVIEDNGIGRSNSRLLKEQQQIASESYGDELIKDLINIFNKYEKMHIEIRYSDKQPPLLGTVVEITIKDMKHEYGFHMHNS